MEPELVERLASCAILVEFAREKTTNTISLSSWQAGREPWTNIQEVWASVFVGVPDVTWTASLLQEMLEAAKSDGKQPAWGC